MTKDELVRIVNKALDSFLDEHVDACFADIDADQVFIETWDFFGDHPVFKHSDKPLPNNAIPKRSHLTKHDRVRYDRAMACDLDDVESLRDAIRGLQSTDAPELVPLYDRLSERLRELEE